jgi:hypothetical protein
LLILYFYAIIILRVNFILVKTGWGSIDDLITGVVSSIPSSQQPGGMR